MVFIIIAVMAIIFLLLWACLDIVPQAEARVIERLGVFHSVWNAGIHVKIPILDKAVVPHIDLREQILELPRTYSYTDDLSREEDRYSESRHLNASNNSDYSATANVQGSIRAYGVPNARANASATTGLMGRILNRKNVSRFSSVKYDSFNRTVYSDWRDVITKDNVTMHVDAAVFYQVTDPKQYAYGMKQPLFALQKLTVTTLRNIIGTLELDETLCSREYINSALRATLDEATDAWGIKITRVEIESILPPPEIQDAMDRQAKAERDKRATILLAEGNKQRVILEAEAEKKATVLAAEAEKEKKILEAEGFLREKELEALGIKALNENAPNDSVIRLKAIQGMEKVSEGPSNKIIIPSEMQGLVGLANGLVEGAR